MIQLSSADSPLLPGHITSNEPGFYEEGSFGIRLESVLVVKEVKTRRQFGDRRWFGFERLTMVSLSLLFSFLPDSRKV